MPGDSLPYANRWRGTATTFPTSTTATGRRMSWSHSFRLTLVIIVIFGLPVLMVNAVPYARGHQRTIRLCSKNLSDALYLVCRDRGGYNEPFAYSGEESVRASSGGGLVEECCYRPCSLEQLEQYCKPAPDDKIGSQDGIEESLRIVNLPYSSTRELATERRAGVAAVGDNNESPKKSKHRKKARVKKLDCNAMRGRKHGYHAERGLKVTKISEAERRSTGKRARARRIGNSENNDDDDDDDVNDDAREATIRECRRRRRWRRRRRGKALREAAAANVPEFKVGTTFPEPKDSLLLFPSRSNNVFQEASLDLASVEDIENLEKFNSLDVKDRYRNKNLGIDRALAVGHP